jgi:hypothetical protein
MRRQWIIMPLVLLLPIGLFAAQQRKRPLESLPQVSPTAPSAPTWNEPDEFRGLKFGEDLRQMIPECPSSYTAGRKYYHWTDTKERCWQPLFAPSGPEAVYELHNFPSLGRVPAGQLWAMQIDNRFSHISITVEHDLFADDLRQMLVTRYGRPTEDKTVQVQTKAGAFFTSRELTWAGKHINVEFHERSTRIDETRVDVYTLAWMAYQQQKRDQLRRQGAEGLSR